MSASCASRRLPAPCEAAWAALTDPAALAAWLPPGDMGGEVRGFELRVGGGYVMSLFYPEGETERRGKSGAREDRVQVRFVSLEPPRRMVQAARFEAEDAAFGGEMTIIWAFAPRPGGCEATVAFENLPPGVRREDNDAGARQSLEQLARWLEGRS